MRARSDDLAGLLSWIGSPRQDRTISILGDDKQWHPVGYPELASSVRSIAGAMRSAGTGAGDRVCILCPAGAPFVSAFFATLWSGACATPLPLPVLYQQPKRYWSHIDALLGATRPKLIITSSAAADSGLLAKAAAEVGAGILTLESAAGFAEAERVPSGDLALIQFTSGSSGPPKPTRVTTANLAANVAAMRSWVQVSGDDIGASWLPQYHDMGLTGCMILPVSVQLSWFYLRPEQFIMQPLTWLKCFGAMGATVTASPNFGYHYAARRVPAERLDGMDFSGWRVAIIGAERVNAHTLGMFAGLLAPFGFRAEALYPAYGMAEATLAVAGRYPGEPLSAASVDWSQAAMAGKVPVSRVHHAPDFADPDASSWVVSCGKPVEGTDVTIIDDDGQPLPDGMLGEIAVSGTSVADGYLGGPGGTSTSFAAAGLRTGDDGFLWDGELYVTGRRGDGLKVAGRSLYSEQVELEVCRAAALNPGRCTALLGSRAGTDLAAVVVEQPPGPWVEPVAATLARLTGGISYEVWSAPRGTIPRTTSGKPSRRAAWRSLAAAELAATCVHRAEGTGPRLPKASPAR